MPVRPRGSKLHAPEPVKVRPAPELVLEGRILYRGKVIPAEVGIGDDGRIVAVAPQVPGGERRDLGECLILPSATDLHVHFRDPSPPGAVEDFASGSLQAALGGVGAVVDMPNTDPPTVDLEAVEEKEARVRSKSCVDALLLAALRDRSAVEALAARASGFKLYLAPTTGGLEAPSSPGLRPLLERVAACDSAVHVHAEEPAGFHPERRPDRPEGWDAVRPAESERAALERLLPPPPGLRLHLAHATTASTATRALESGLSVEATPHHLLLSYRSLSDARGKVNPPLRSPTEQAALFRLFQEGKVTALASDHAPHALSEKGKAFPDAPSGVPGVETMLPLFLARVRSGELSLGVLQRAAARRPALFLGLPRGALAVGMEANLLVVDFRQRKRLRARDLHAPCGWTPFEGYEAIFPREHYLLGERIVEDGEYVGGRSGRLLRRASQVKPPTPPLRSLRPSEPPELRGVA